VTLLQIQLRINFHTSAAKLVFLSKISRYYNQQGHFMPQQNQQGMGPGVQGVWGGKDGAGGKAGKKGKGKGKKGGKKGSKLKGGKSLRLCGNRTLT
jgi:hypothetical protein